MPVVDPITDVDPTTPTPPQTEESSTFHSEYDVRRTIRPIAEDEGVCDISDVEQQDSGGSEDMGGHENGDSEYMGGQELEEGFGNPGDYGYERRELLVELGPDDRAEGYRG